MTEKLDLFSKILLATSTINYMASSLNAVNEQYKVALAAECIDEEDNGLSKNILTTLVAEQDKKLEALTNGLIDMIRDFGSYLNKKDCVCAIDARIYKAPSEILVEGKDEVNNTYNDESVWMLQFGH